MDLSYIPQWLHIDFKYTLYFILCILSAGFWHCVMKNHWEAIQLDIRSLVIGDFGAGAVLITYGVLLGKVNAN